MGKKVQTVLRIDNNKMLFMYTYSDQKLLWKKCIWNIKNIKMIQLFRKY